MKGKAKTKGRVNCYDVVQAWLRTWKPDCAFAGSDRDDFRAWKKKFRRHYRQCLGRWPERVPLNLTVTDRVRCEDHVRERVLFDSSPGVAVPAYILTPLNEGKEAGLPALVAAHGHGGGKDDVAGVTREVGTEAGRNRIENLNYEYGLDAVRRGYVVIAPDWCPFGERRAPDWWTRPGRDACNVLDLAWLYFGRPLLTQNIWDGMRAVDVLCQHPRVDVRRIAVIGLSYGGTMATHLLINDRRIRAGVVSGYLSTVRGDALGERGKGNTCGAQHVPGILAHGDIPDMLGLAVPKPILIEMGKKETCFHFPDMQKALKHLERIYTAAGFPERLAADVHPHDHRWSGAKAWKWLKSWGI
jgi:dienelactone hydrolase